MVDAKISAPLPHLRFYADLGITLEQLQSDNIAGYQIAVGRIQEVMPSLVKFSADQGINSLAAFLRNIEANAADKSARTKAVAAFNSQLRLIYSQSSNAKKLTEIIAKIKKEGEAVAAKRASGMVSGSEIERMESPSTRRDTARYVDTFDIGLISLLRTAKYSGKSIEFPTHDLGLLLEEALKTASGGYQKMLMLMRKQLVTIEAERGKYDYMFSRQRNDRNPDLPADIELQYGLMKLEVARFLLFVKRCSVWKECQEFLSAEEKRITSDRAADRAPIAASSMSALSSQSHS